jgi:hypothetical protein
MPGVATVLHLYPDAGVAVVVLLNSNNGGAASRIARALAAALLPVRPGADRPPPDREGGPGGPGPEWMGRWRGHLLLPDETVPVSLDVRAEEDVRIRVGRQPRVDVNDARLRDGWLTGRFADQIAAPDAAPADQREHSAVLNLRLRGDRLGGWISALSDARPTFGAVSFRLELRRQPEAPAGAERPVIPTTDIRTLEAHLAVLAADSLEGRGAGYRGDSVAAAYIASQFAQAGLEPAGDRSGRGTGYLQRFPLHPRRPTSPFEVRWSQNVVGILRGSDPAVRDELVVVGAHFDGQGRAGQADMGRAPADSVAGDSIWNSANDNGAAVAALLTLAQALAASKPHPRRSVAFVAFGAEEHGLVGSLHYVAHPPVPWERHAAMINLEMIGWAPGRSLNIRATGTSTEWPALIELASDRTDLPVTMRQPQLTNDTDHYGFGVRGVPSVHYGVGGSRTRYHRVTDELDGIAFATLADRTRHATALLLELADRPQRLAFTWRHPPDPGITGTRLTEAERRALGTAPGGGVKVTATAVGLAAHAAGLRAGDVVVAVNGKELEADADMRAIYRHLRSAPDRPARLTVMREGRRMEMEVRWFERDAGAAPPVQ